jgi:hypothetical protein
LKATKEKKSHGRQFFGPKGLGMEMRDQNNLMLDRFYHERYMKVIFDQKSHVVEHFDLESHVVIIFDRKRLVLDRYDH